MRGILETHDAIFASIMCISQKRGLEEDTREPKIESLISRSNNFV